MTEACLWLVASIAAGEAPISLMGEDAFTAVVWTMRNRMGNWSWPCERLPEAYYARGAPTLQEVAAVRAAFRARDDPTGGGLWALSREDRARWGLRRGDLVYSRAGFELHIYRSDPWSGSRRRSTGS